LLTCSLLNGRAYTERGFEEEESPEWFMSDSKWLQQMREWLCEMYKFWGGHCAELPFDVPQRISFLNSLYQEQGPPPLTTQPQIDEFLVLLEVIYVELGSPSNCLPPASTAELRTLIQSLQAHFHPPVR
jgi:hypothetical protein